MSSEPRRAVSAIEADLQQLVVDLDGWSRDDDFNTLALEDAVRALFRAGVALREAVAGSIGLGGPSATTAGAL